MTRSVNGTVSHKRHKKVLARAKGYRGRAKNCFTVALNKTEKGLRYAYRGRKERKRQFRSLWIIRINAAARQHGLIYSQFIAGLKRSGVELDRKVLADLAVHEPETFAALAKQAADGLKKAV